MLILGSQSPRRKEILGFFAVPFTCISPDFDETEVPFKGDPIAYVEEIARSKAESIHLNKEDLLLTADTTVHKDGRILNKPEDENEAFEMLKFLSGSSHEVYTGLCLKKGNNTTFCHEMTKVYFKKTSNEQLKLYHKSIYSQDKAGGYAIQQAGAIIIEKIEGCPYNVMGLPIGATNELLTQHGISLWDYLGQ